MSGKVPLSDFSPTVKWLEVVSYEWSNFLLCWIDKTGKLQRDEVKSILFHGKLCKNFGVMMSL